VRGVRGFWWTARPASRQVPSGRSSWSLALSFYTTAFRCTRGVAKKGERWPGTGNPSPPGFMPRSEVRSKRECPTLPSRSSSRPWIAASSRPSKPSFASAQASMATQACGTISTTALWQIFPMAADIGGRMAGEHCWPRRSGTPRSSTVTQARDLHQGVSIWAFPARRSLTSPSLAPAGRLRVRAQQEGCRPSPRLRRDRGTRGTQAGGHHQVGAGD